MLPSNPNDKQLTAAIQQGGRSKEEAINFLLERYIYYVPTMSRKFHQPEADVLDAYTDALMILLDHIVQARFRGKSAISTYLYKILFNKCRDLSKKKSTNTVALEDWAAHLEPSSQNILKDFLVSEQVGLLYQYMDKLGETCKQILLDWAYWGYSMEEIADRSSLEDADQAKRKKYKCLQKLRALLP